MKPELILPAALVIFLLYHTASGWRKGVARQLVSIFALLISYVAAWFASPYALTIVRPLGYPDLLLQVAAGVVIALIVYAFVRALGALLFKRTAQQPGGLIRFAYGVGGAVIGLAFGVVLIWAGCLLVNLLGTLAQSQMTAMKGGNQTPAPIVQNVAALRTELLQSPVAPTLKTIDPIPKSIYDILDKTGRMASNPEAVQRFLTFPGVQPLTQNPKLLELQKDSEIMQKIQKHQFIELLRNEKLVDAANDPVLGQMLRDFELGKALDYALNGQQR